VRVHTKYTFFNKNEDYSSDYKCCYSRKTIRDVVVFISDDTKEERIEKFEQLFDCCIEDLLSKTRVNEMIDRFITLKQLDGHKNEQIERQGSKESVAKNYYLIPLEDILKTEKANYDVVFTADLIKSNNKDSSLIEFTPDLLKNGKIYQKINAKYMKI